MLKIYQNSLSLALFLLFLVSFVLHLVGSSGESCREQLLHGQPCSTVVEQLTRRLTAITKAHQIAGEPSPATMQQPAVSETFERHPAHARYRPTHQSGVADRRHPPYARRSAGHTGRLPRPRPPTSRLCRRLPPLRTCRSRLRRRSCRQTTSLVVKLRRSKTDPEGQGRDVGIPYGSTAATCPVRALDDLEDCRRHR